MANPIAKIQLKTGEVMVLELYPDKAPLSVANFVKLAKEGYYDGLCFHRIIPNFMIQGGGFVHEGRQLREKGKAATIKGEFKANGVANDLSHQVGVISMARTNVKDSATSQFFICVGDAGFLDGNYAAFGKTVDKASADVAVKLSKVPTGSVGYYDDVPNTPVVIDKITIEEK